METQKMENSAPAVEPQCGPQQPCGPQPVNDWEFNIGRAYLLLLVVLVLPIYLSLSLITFSLGAMVV
jgi:hypothetical protein